MFSSFPLILELELVRSINSNRGSGERELINKGWCAGRGGHWELIRNRAKSDLRYRQSFIVPFVGGVFGEARRDSLRRTRSSKRE